MNVVHLPINQQAHPKHWISLCNRTGDPIDTCGTRQNQDVHYQRNIQFTLDFNDATCEDCVELELEYSLATVESEPLFVLEDSVVFDDERGNPLFI